MQPFVGDVKLLDRLAPLDTKILTTAQDSASSVATRDDHDLCDETADPADEMYLEDCKDGVEDVEGAPIATRLRSGTCPEAATASSGPVTPLRGPSSREVSTPASVATAVTAATEEGADTIKQLHVGDWQPTRKFRKLPKEAKALGMRKHKFGPEYPCRGSIPTTNYQCRSLHQKHQLQLSVDAAPMCKALNELVKLTLTRYEETTAAFTETLFQTLHMPALKVLCKVLSNDLKVYDVRSLPFLTLSEGTSYFTGYGDTVITLEYPIKKPDGQDKIVEMVVCTNELKPNTLTTSNGMGQVAGQTVHFNGRHCRSRKLETILKQPLHFCSGVLSNPVSSVGLTLSSDQQFALFLVEAVEHDTMGCIATMLARALDVRDIVLGRVVVKDTYAVEVEEEDDDLGGHGAGGVDEDSAPPDDNRPDGGGAPPGTSKGGGGGEPSETQGPATDSLNLAFDSDDASPLHDFDDEVIVIKAFVPQIRAVSEKHRKIAMTENAIMRFIASGVSGTP